MFSHTDGCFEFIGENIGISPELYSLVQSNISQGKLLWRPFCISKTVCGQEEKKRRAKRERKRERRKE